MIETPNASKGTLAQIVAEGTRQRVLAFTSLIILLIGFSIASPNFMQTSNMIAILQATSVNGIPAISVTLVIIAGGIDLSVGKKKTFWCCLYGCRADLCRNADVFSGYRGRLDSRTGIDRRDGFLNQMESEYPGVEL